MQNAFLPQLLRRQAFILPTHQVVIGKELEEGVPSAHVVVGAFHHGFGAFINEAHRAVFRVVGDLPDAGGCPDQCLIAVRVVNRLKGGFFSAPDGGVLVEWAGCAGTRF